MAQETFKHNLHVATEIRKLVRAGVKINTILEAIQRFDGAPRTLPTLYKYYRSDIAEAKSTVTEQIGNVVVEKALSGDMKAAELYLKSNSGWNPAVRVIEEDDKPTEETGAIDDLLKLLGATEEETKE